MLIGPMSSTQYCMQPMLWGFIGPIRKLLNNHWVYLFDIFIFSKLFLDYVIQIVEIMGNNIFMFFYFEFKT